MSEGLKLSSESVARALICQSEGLGPRLLSRLFSKVDSALSLFENPDRLATLDVEGLGKKRSRTLSENLEKWNLEAAEAKLRSKNIGLLAPPDELYPTQLAEIFSPPPVLFYRGNPQLLDAVSVAIVGTRSCTETGQKIAGELARGLAELGVNVVSGMAAGIDSAAHRGALESGKTSAVLGTGVDRVYPRRNRELYRTLVDEQLLVSEYPPGTEPSREHFPARNRIISGLSRAVIVVQAGERSGALITADFALEQGREVYAVPGSLNNNKHRGCHMLIKRGAGLVENVEDVLDYLQLEGHFSPEDRQVTISSGAAKLLELLSAQPVHIDQLVLKTDFNLGECSRLLLELENKDLVLSLPGQQYQKSSDARHLDVEVETSATEGEAGDDSDEPEKNKD